MDTTYHFGLQKVLPMLKTEQEFVSEFFKLTEEPLDKYLAHMFEPLIPNLLDIIIKQFKLDPFMCLRLSVQTQHFVKIYVKDSYIMKILTQCQEQIASLFTKFIDSQAYNIQSSKMTHIKRIGVLEHVKTLIKFIDKMEFMWAKDSGIAEPAYNTIIRTVFKFISNTADLSLVSAPILSKTKKPKNRILQNKLLLFLKSQDTLSHILSDLKTITTSGTIWTTLM